MLTRLMLTRLMLTRLMPAEPGVPVIVGHALSMVHHETHTISNELIVLLRESNQDAPSWAARRV